MRTRNRQTLGGRLFTFIFAILVCMTVVILHALTKELYVKTNEYSIRQEAIAEEMLKEQERAEALENQRIYVQTDKYKIEMAREKLGLVFPDETVLKPE